MEQSGLTLSTQAHLGDPVFLMNELEGWPMPPAPLGFPADPRELELRVIRLEAQVYLLDRAMADMQARTLSAQWRRLVLWCRTQWRKFLAR